MPDFVALSRKVLEHTGWNNAQWARAIDRSPGAISHWLMGRSPPSLTALVATEEASGMRLVVDMLGPDDPEPIALSTEELELVQRLRGIRNQSKAREQHALGMISAMLEHLEANPQPRVRKRQ
jgi:hypothetical protein